MRYMPSGRGKVRDTVGLLILTWWAIATTVLTFELTTWRIQILCVFLAALVWWRAVRYALALLVARPGQAR